MLSSKYQFYYLYSESFRINENYTDIRIEIQISISMIDTKINSKFEMACNKQLKTQND